MTETLIVALIVLATLVYVIRRFYRSLTGRNRGCSCGTRQCDLPTPCAPPSIPPAAKDTDNTPR